MQSKIDYDIRTFDFDRKIFEMGKWEFKGSNMSKLIEKLNEWINSTGEEKKRALSAQIISILISLFLKKHLVVDAEKRIESLCEKLVHLEALLKITLSGLGKKFYRDHLNHMVRVMLLMNAIGYKTLSSKDFKRQQKALIITGLLHDIGLPLAEAREVVDQIANTIKGSYVTVNITLPTFSYNITPVVTKFRYLPEVVAKHPGYLEGYNHGIIGALEILNWVGEWAIKGYRHIVQAIALHDSKIDMIQIRFSENPILSLLVICDELQDWGRPVGLSTKPAFPEIKNFYLDQNKLAGVYDYSEVKDKSISPLRQIEGKDNNFSRIILDVGFPNFQIEFKLPEYKTVEGEKFASLLRKIFKDFDEEFSDYLRNYLCRKFMKTYFKRLPLRTDSDIILSKMFEEMKRPTKYEDYIVYDEKRQEMLVIPRELDTIDSIRFKKDNNGVIKLEVQSSGKWIQGMLIPLERIGNPDFCIKKFILMPSLGYVIMCYLIVREEELPTSERVPDVYRTYWKVEEYREVGFAGFINDFQKKCYKLEEEEKTIAKSMFEIYSLKDRPDGVFILGI